MRSPSSGIAPPWTAPSHMLLLFLLVSVLTATASFAGRSRLHRRQQPTTPIITNAWKLLYQNDADWDRARSSNIQVGYLLYSGKVTGAQVVTTCAAMQERPAVMSSPVEIGLQRQLNYLITDKSYPSGQKFYVNNVQTTAGRCSTLTVTNNSVKRTYAKCTTALPVICSQSAGRTTADAATTPNATTAVTVKGLTAYRDAFSFRFLRLPFANTPQRFGYSTVYTGGQAGSSASCPTANDQTGEDCLVANVYTPIISGGTNPLALKPVMMWVYGGGFTTGSGQDETFDGGSLASRGDVVVVTPNYRIGTLGFLSINSAAPGNYALSDLITCLRWIKSNAATFGGDPNRVTIVGQSAGGQLVETLLSSRAAAGLFQRAIVQSGRPADAANRLISADAALAGPSGATISALGCSPSDPNVLNCLRGLPTSAFFNAPVFARSVVDGNRVTQPNLDVAKKRGGYVNQVPVIWGYMRDEMASLGYTPPISQKNLDAALTSAGINAANRSIVENNTSLFPIGNAPNGVQALTVAVQTDITSIARCGQQSTISAAASTGFFPNIYAYVQNQRSYQIRGYDPYGVCTSTSSASSGYYLCHSGDLYPLFNTAGYVAQYPVRDPDDVIHSALMMDYWTAFARTGNPNPSSGYLTARGYSSTASRINGKTWTPTTSSSSRMLSLGPRPSMIALEQRGPQCSALARPLNYVSQGR